VAFDYNSVLLDYFICNDSDDGTVRVICIQIRTEF